MSENFKKKLTVAVLYGGRSSEHEVSVHSAAEVCRLLSKKYKVIKILITKEDGLWHLQKECGGLSSSDITVSPLISKKGNIMFESGKILKADFFFPVLHGAMGEDGTMQGLFEILGAPYGGCGVLSSALGMDKELTKILASRLNIPIVPYIKVFAQKKISAEVYARAAALGYPLFVKPLSLGSSIGASKVKEEKNLARALSFAFKYEDAALVERAVENPREVFCAVLGGGAGGKIEVSSCAELKVLNSEFFDYKAKYEDPHGCDIITPAPLPLAVERAIKEDSAKIFGELRGRGFARVDFFVSREGQYYFSEINTIPGMSLTSLFPQMWKADGKKYAAVLERIVELGLKRKKERDKFSLNR